MGRRSRTLRLPMFELLSKLEMFLLRLYRLGSDPEERNNIDVVEQRRLSLTYCVTA